MRDNGKKKNGIDFKDFMRRYFVVIIAWIGAILVYVLNIFLQVSGKFEEFVGIYLLLIFLTIIYLIYSHFKNIDAIRKLKSIKFYNIEKRRFWVFMSLVPLSISFALMIYVSIIGKFSFELIGFYFVEILILWYILLLTIYVYYSGSVSNWYNNMVVQRGQEIADARDGYTERPYTMKLLSPIEVENLHDIIPDFGERMVNHLLIAGYESIDGGVIFYLPSPTLMSGIMGVRKDIQQATRVTAYHDGDLSVHVSRNDYDRIGLEVTYHELCQRLLKGFGDSIKAFIKGDEKKAVETLGGKDHTKKRKRTFRSQVHSFARIAAVLTIANFILMVGVFQSDVVVLDKDFSNYQVFNGGYGSGGVIIFEMYASYPIFGYLRQHSVTEGDELFISFSANITIPRVYIYLFQIGFPIVSKILTNVTSGDFQYKALANHSRPFLRFYLMNESTGAHVIANIHVTIKHLNTYSSKNPWIAFMVLILYTPVEFTLWWKRQGLYI